jgi:hypothetical protein
LIAGQATIAAVLAEIGWFHIAAKIATVDFRNLTSPPTARGVKQDFASARGDTVPTISFLRAAGWMNPQ